MVVDVEWDIAPDRIEKKLEGRDEDNAMPDLPDVRVCVSLRFALLCFASSVNVLRLAVQPRVAALMMPGWVS